MTLSSNNTNKLSPQEQSIKEGLQATSSNNTNKLSPQEHHLLSLNLHMVQIIQINLVLKNLVQLVTMKIKFK